MSTDPINRAHQAFEMLAGPARRLRLSIETDYALFPLHPDTMENDAALQVIDAFLQRFQQVVDLTLRKLFPKLVAALEQREERIALRPVLDRLERESLIDKADWWSDVNELRNRLVHEYAMTPIQRATELNHAWRTAPKLLEHLEVVGHYLRTRDE